MPRILVLAAAWLAACGAATRPAPGPDAPRAILYVDADSPAVDVSIAKFEAALERRGIAARHHTRVLHVAVDVFRREEAAARIRAALREHPALVIATSSESAGIAREAAPGTPIVFGSHQDPVRLGLVRSLADPGGNLTGIATFVPIDLKRLELLREAAPRARRLGIVIDRWWMQENDGEGIVRDARTQFGFEGRTFLMEKPEDLRELRSAAAREMDAWYVPQTTLAYEHPAALIEGLAALGKPAIFPTTRYAEAGGLMAYQARMPLDDALDLFAKIVGLILDGVPPGSIPVERPKAFDLVVNATQARRLHLALPDALVKRADRVIDTPQPGQASR